jgi:hypothetical protein
MDPESTVLTILSTILFFFFFLQSQKADSTNFWILQKADTTNFSSEWPMYCSLLYTVYQ